MANVTFKNHTMYYNSFKSYANLGNPDKSLSYDDMLIKCLSYGVLLTEEDYNKLVDTKLFMRFIEENLMSAFDFSRTLHKDWTKLANDEVQNLSNTIKNFVIDNDVNVENTQVIDILEFDKNVAVPQHFQRLIKIKIDDLNEIKENIESLMYSNMAFSQEVIDMLFEFMEVLKIDVKLDEIKNKELTIKLCDKFDLVPYDTDNFIMYFIYKVTGTTLKVKSLQTLKNIQTSYDTLSSLLSKYLKGYGNFIGLAQGFNRNKDFFIEVKAQLNYDIENKGAIDYPNLKRYVNKISRLSKKHHKPKGIPDYLNLITADLKTFDRVIEKMDTTYLLKLYKAIKLRIILNSERMFEDKPNIIKFLIRNGKSFYKIYENKGIELVEKEKRIKKLVAKKINDNLFNSDYDCIVLDKNVDLALITSEKMALSNLPIGTILNFDVSEENLVVGIYWKNNDRRVDLDLSMALLDGNKIGWDGSSRSENILFSGDVTDAPNGAVELFHFKNSNKLNDEEKQMLVDVRDYTSNKNVFYTFFISNLERDIVSKTKKSNLYKMVDINKITNKLRIKSKDNGVIGVMDFDKSNFIVTNIGRSDNITYSSNNVKIDDYSYKNRELIKYEVKTNDSIMKMSDILDDLDIAKVYSDEEIETLNRELEKTGDKPLKVLDLRQENLSLSDIISLVK